MTPSHILPRDRLAASSEYRHDYAGVIAAKYDGPSTDPIPAWRSATDPVPGWRCTDVSLTAAPPPHPTISASVVTAPTMMPVEDPLMSFIPRNGPKTREIRNVVLDSEIGGFARG